MSLHKSKDEFSKWMSIVKEQNDSLSIQTLSSTEGDIELDIHASGDNADKLMDVLNASGIVAKTDTHNSSSAQPCSRVPHRPSRARSPCFHWSPRQSSHLA